MTARPIQPGELLDLAGRLAGSKAGPGRPKTIELRRAVSTAYYALFHELAWRGTEELLREGGGRSPRAAEVSRWITHTELLTLSRAAAGQGTPALRLALGSLSGDVVRIAEAFVELQGARHSADYDDEYDLSRAIALGHVDTARDAVSRSDRLLAADDPTYRLFLRLMLSAAQAKKRSA